MAAVTVLLWIIFGAAVLGFVATIGRRALLIKTGKAAPVSPHKPFGGTLIRVWHRSIFPGLRRAYTEFGHGVLWIGHALRAIGAGLAHGFRQHMRDATGPRWREKVRKSFGLEVHKGEAMKEVVAYPSKPAARGGMGKRVPISRGFFSRGKKSPEKVAKTAKPSKGLLPNDLVARGFELIEQKQLTLAEETFIRALAKDHKLTDAYMGLAHVYMAQKEYSYAIESARQAIKIAPLLQRHRPYLLLGGAYQKQDKHEQAIKYFEQDMSKHKNDAGVLVALGASLTAIGEKRHAEIVLRKALAFAPANKDAQKLLLKLRKEDNKQKAAELAKTRGEAKEKMKKINIAVFRRKP